jgi:serine protease
MWIFVLTSLTYFYSWCCWLVFEAVGWMIEQGARVINMSLGGPEQSQAGERMMQTAYDAGALVIAAAGNTGSQDLHYPASYPHVISVVAVDEDEDIAAFSQYNSAVDISAPGAEILSTVPPGTGGVVLLTTTSAAAPGIYMKFSPKQTVAIEGELVDCGYGETECPKGITAQKHICLIQR